MSKIIDFKNRYQKEEGFTLIELMIVVVIIGVLAASLKSDVKNTHANLVTYLVKNPTASIAEITNRAAGPEATPIPEGLEGSGLYPITISDPATSVAVFGATYAKGWNNYTVRAWNTQVDPEATLTVAGKNDVYFRSTTGKITIGG